MHSGIQGRHGLLFHAILYNITQYIIFESLYRQTMDFVEIKCKCGHIKKDRLTPFVNNVTISLFMSLFLELHTKIMKYVIKVMQITFHSIAFYVSIVHRLHLVLQ